MADKPSPFQARLIRLLADGFRLSHSGYFAPPRGDGEMDGYKRMREEVGTGLTRGSWIPKRTMLSLSAKGLTRSEWIEQEGDDRWGRPIRDHIVLLTDAAKEWLAQAKPEDFISPERKPSDKPLFTATEILDMLKERYSGSRYAFFREFTLGTGAWANRRIDAFVMGLWPSDGYVRMAFEVKVSRSDFLREMKDERKRARAAKFTDQFWFAAPMDLIKPDELPDEIGLIEARMLGDDSSMLRVKKKAKPTPTPDLPMWIIASIVRRVDRIESDHLLNRRAEKLAFGYRPIKDSIEDVRNGKRSKDDFYRIVRYWFEGGGLEDKDVKNYLERYNRLHDPEAAV